MGGLCLVRLRREVPFLAGAVDGKWGGACLKRPRARAGPSRPPRHSWGGCAGGRAAGGFLARPAPECGSWAPSQAPDSSRSRIARTTKGSAGSSSSSTAPSCWSAGARPPPGSARAAARGSARRRGRGSSLAADGVLPAVRAHRWKDRVAPWVEAVLREPGEDRRGSNDSRVAIGQTPAGRYLRVVYVRDLEPHSLFVVTAYELSGKP